MATTATLDNDPDVLWIRLRCALREGRLNDAADAQRRLADAGITVRIAGLELRTSGEGRDDA